MIIEYLEGCLLSLRMWFVGFVYLRLELSLCVNHLSLSVSSVESIDLVGSSDSNKASDCSPIIAILIILVTQT